jgi:hypothetical protein
MTDVWQIVLALAFPIACLLMVLWLARLEDNLVRDVRRAERKPDPAPILRVPARAVVTLPVQASEGSRSAAVSLGGNTNR